MNVSTACQPVMLALGIIAAGAAIVSLRAQVPDAPAFEVASIKRNVSGDQGSSRNVGVGGRLVFNNFPLRQLITAAYDIQSFQLIGGPSWINSERYDVEAKAAAETPLAQMYLRMRTLLAERFKLVVHQEARELPVYHLVKARADGPLGPHLKRSSVDCGPSGRGVPQPGAPPGPPVGCRAFISPAQIVFEGQTTAQLVRVLGMTLRETVIDRTNLTGGYDLQLSFAPDFGRSGPPPGGASATAGAPVDDPNLPSLFTALEEQLGLKLERQRSPVEVVVIDSIDKLIEN